MADISASMVMELRQRTGLGMMECKKVLAEAAGDLAKAEELLRIRSGAKATKAAGRVAAEGIVGAHVADDGRTAAMVEVNCETDFVSRNEDFVAFAKALARLVVERSPADVAALSALPHGGGTVESVRQALVQKIGENISIRRYSRYATTAQLVQYLHGGGRIGVTVEIEGGRGAGGQGRRDAHRRVGGARRDPPGVRVARRRAGRPHRARARDLHGAGRRERQARRDRGADGRGPRQQVPRRGDAARPGVREEPRRDGGEVPQGATAPP